MLAARAMGQIPYKKKVNSICGIDSNANSKNIYIKANFNIYSIIYINADADKSNTSVINENVNNNRNNKDVGQSGRMKNINKTGFDIINTSKKSRINI